MSLCGTKLRTSCEDVAREVKEEEKYTFVLLFFFVRDHLADIPAVVALETFSMEQRAPP